VLKYIGTLLAEIDLAIGEEENHDKQLVGRLREASDADPQGPSLVIRNTAIVVQHARPIIGKQVEFTFIALTKRARGGPAAALANRELVRL
jgi:hypothetical protein